MDNACGAGAMGTDADFDGLLSSSDCSDTDLRVRDGTSTQADCSSGNWRTCSGTSYTAACAALSTFTCHSGSGATIWYDFSTGDNTNAGTYASPKKDYIALSNSGAAGYRAPVCGDCHVFMDTAAYTTSWSDGGTTRQLYILNKDCNSTDKLTIRSAPGKVAKFQAQGTAIPIDIEGSDFAKLVGIELDGSTSTTTTTGIYINGSNDVELSDLYVHDIDGTAANNVACLKVNGAARSYSHHNFFKDCYDRGSETNENNTQVVLFDGDDHRVEYNTLWTTFSTGAGKLFKFKHGDLGASWTFIGNIASKGNQACVMTAQGGAQISGNYLEECNEANSGAAIQFSGGEGGTFFDQGSTIEYNTIYNSNPFELFTSESDEDGTTYGLVTVRKNVVIDDQASSYSTEGTEGFIRICHYGDAAQYSAIIGGSKLSLTNNCYYNSTALALFFDVFEDGVGDGDSYANFSAWQAGGYDSGSFSKDPSLNADKQATDADCDEWGWSPTAGGGGGGGSPVKSLDGFMGPSLKGKFHL